LLIWRRRFRRCRGWYVLSEFGADVGVEVGFEFGSGVLIVLLVWCVVSPVESVGSGMRRRSHVWRAR
jgi:hypothetical protein